MERWEYNENRLNDPSYDKYRRYTYTCGFCGNNVSGYVKIIYLSVDNNPTSSQPEWILIRYLLCPSCSHASVWHKDSNEIIPGSLIGRKLNGLPPIVEVVYEEARRTFSVSAYTACELLCRKILMNIAVEKGAEENKTFQYYIEYLERENFITPGIKEWADKIRTNGNDATHEIDTPDKIRSKSTFLFTEQLLTIIYEMPYLANLNQEQ